jgi:predicted nuclease of predicted toxin-antitoxin system
MARLLLDENLPILLARALPNHEVRTVRQMRWRGIRNGELLRLAQGQFDVFLTMDRSIPFQQSVAGLDIAVVVIRARSNRPDELSKLTREIDEAARKAVAGTATSVGNWPPPSAPASGSPSA